MTDVLATWTGAGPNRDGATPTRHDVATTTARPCRATACSPPADGHLTLGVVTEDHSGRSLCRRGRMADVRRSGLPERMARTARTAGPCRRSDRHTSTGRPRRQAARGRRAGGARERSSRDARASPSTRTRGLRPPTLWAAPSVGYPVRFEPHPRADQSAADARRTPRQRVPPAPLALMRLLIVHHTPSPAVHAMLEAVRSGATDPSIEGVDVVARRTDGDGDRRARSRRLPARHAGQPRLHLRRAQALLRPDLLPVPRGDRRASVRRVPPRQQRHHRGLRADRDDHDRACGGGPRQRR